jgi:hypothetical protein
MFYLNGYPTRNFAASFYKKCGKGSCSSHLMFIGLKVFEDKYQTGQALRFNVSAHRKET